MYITIYKGKKFQIFPEVYKPAEDTFLIADNLDVNKGEKVLELGTGCGIISILAAKRGAEVIATDINPEALRCAEENSINQQVENKIDFREGDLFKTVGKKKFDLIIFNPPYLPVNNNENGNTDLEKAWNGGQNGRKIIDRFLKKIPDYLKSKGRSMFVQSSLTGTQKTLDILKRKKFKIQTKTEKLSFEKLYLYIVKRKAV